MAARGRGNIACTPEVQFRLLWLIGRGWTRGEAAAACGMHPDTVTRHGYRDPLFKEQLAAAYERKRHRRPVAVH